MRRHEIKLVGVERDYERVRCELALLPAALQTLHPTRIVQSVYLDTHDDRALHENLAGISSRRKVRFRWYGEATARARGRLEQKRRDNLFGTKRVFPVEQELELAGADRYGFVAALRDALPADGGELLHGLGPAQWIRYRRDYLTDRTGRLRVTIDRDLMAFDQRFSTRLACDRRTPIPRLLIVEIKAEHTARDDIERFLQRCELRPSKCSKFVLASAPGEAPLGSPY